MTIGVGKTKFWNVSQPGSLEILHATNVLVSSSRYTHETLTLGIINQRTALLSSKQKLYSISVDYIVVINPDDVYTCHT
ncbi:MAG: hypothetical protein V7K53_12900 [Nostoc sp.]|uniref:hypothetical protein n=1 Tax=Nostoc sp. TaxID=1180 RepID=UPI002FF5D12C